MRCNPDVRDGHAQETMRAADNDKSFDATEEKVLNTEQELTSTHSEPLSKRQRSIESIGRDITTDETKKQQNPLDDLDVPDKQAQDSIPATHRNRAAEAAESRAKQADTRGIGDIREAKRQDAAGTRNYFGASAAAKLRQQLSASRVASSSARVATSKNNSEESCAKKIDLGSTKTAAVSEPQDTLPSGAIWLCFRCLLTRGEESERIENDCLKHTCTQCGARPPRNL